MPQRFLKGGGKLPHPFGTVAAASVWLFQANPDKYDILNALSDEKIGNSIHWLVNQHKGEIRQGHIGLLWMSGKDADIYAVTRVTSNPQLLEESPEEKKY